MLLFKNIWSMDNILLIKHRRMREDLVQTITKTIPI